MQTIEGQTAEGITIAMDDKSFLNCRYTRCTLIFSGGDCEWTADTLFIDCYLKMIGPALRVVNVLHCFSFAKDFGATGPPAPASTTPLVQ